MAQLSRPYQAGLLAVVLLAAAWLLLLQGHSSSPSSSSSSPSPAQTVTHTVTTSSAPVSHGSGAASGATSHVYHGALPGLEGLTKDIAKARGAVETSQQNARQLAEKSAQASDESTQAPAAATPTASVPRTATTPAPSRTVATTSPTSSATTPVKPATGASSSAVPSAQRAVEAQLAQGRIVVILFWNPKGADDTAVHQALAQLQRNASLGIAVHEASAGAVASFGTVTRGVQVYGTPTLLIVNRQGKALTLTGLQDAFTIEQAIQEAKQS